jgi:uncharacterized integral membrane protein
VQNALKGAPRPAEGSNPTAIKVCLKDREEGLQKMGEQRARDFGHQARLVAIIVALGVLALFTALNFDEVEVDMLVAKQDIRLGFALIFSALLGFLVGYFAPRPK